MKIVTVIGARPQFVKAAVVSRAFRRSSTHLDEVVVHTGQHFDVNMSDVFFDELEIFRPDYQLDIHGGSHGAMTGRMLEGIERILLKEKPNLALVYGDTNSTLAGAIAAAKLSIRCAHVEAGLRSFNRRMPEEINRILTDHVSDLLFAPTIVAIENLRREGLGDRQMHLVGDVMYDAALYYGAKSDEVSKILVEQELAPKEYILATIHRAENVDDPDRLRAIFGALIEVAKELVVVLPLHPRTQAALKREQLYEKTCESLRLIAPVGYLDMVMLEKNARLIATDSGGVQKEAYFYRVPCVTLRAETEWVELIETGWNRVVNPSSADVITETIYSSLEVQGLECSLYGAGCAAQSIARELSTL